VGWCWEEGGAKSGRGDRNSISARGESNLSRFPHKWERFTYLENLIVEMVNRGKCEGGRVRGDEERGEEKGGGGEWCVGKRFGRVGEEGGVVGGEKRER